MSSTDPTIGFAGNLESTARTMAADTATYGPAGAVTKCNFFARDLAENVLAMSIPELHPSDNSSGDANSIYNQLLALPDSWEDLTPNSTVSTPDWSNVFQTAVNDAQSTIVFAIYLGTDEHGHIATVMPYDMAMGFNSTIMVPFVAQAGPITEFSATGVDDKLLFSQAFRKARLASMKVFRRR